MSEATPAVRETTETGLGPTRESETLDTLMFYCLQLLSHKTRGYET